jgi:hypothetical protein
MRFACVEGRSDQDSIIATAIISPIKNDPSNCRCKGWERWVSPDGGPEGQFSVIAGAAVPR